MSAKKDASIAEHDRRVLVTRMLDHRGPVRKAGRVYTLLVHGELGRIELTKYSRPHAAATFEPGDRRLRERLVKLFLEHFDEKESAEWRGESPGSPTVLPRR